ncbi:MAG TPA: VWA domain-containing protein [Caulobacteraceae bacterium]|nr:VWA domain-containing protein [Caulobacteraceae bacterium]
MAAMQRTLEDFLRALRAMEVRVSPAEAIDAHRAVAEVGYGDRTLLKDALCVTLAKSEEEVSRFDAAFDTFFTREEFKGAPPPPPSAEARQAEGSPEGAPQGGEAGDLAQMLLSNDAVALAQAMEAAAARARSGDIRLNTQRSLLTRRILDEMGLRELEALINRLRESGLPRDEALAERLAERREALFVEAGRFVERQSKLYASETGRQMRESLLAQQKLTSIEPEDFKAMEAVVRRMAKRLASKYSRKRHRARKGKLDVRRTIRKAMGYGGIPFDIVWKTETIEKPKIIAICDVSRSVAAAAQFLLLFLYSLNEVVERLDAYAFSDRMVSVNDLLDDEHVDDAIELILKRIGFRPTDYGRALADFCDHELEKLDRHTTVIMLGDGRTNYVNPRLDLMKTIAERSRAVIWLNPEPETYWNQGDSKMDAYRRFCHVAKTCNTLNQLERIIEDVLRTYMPS